MTHYLIAYATKQGSTGEIAEAIGRELRSAGDTADVRDVATAVAPAGYDRIILGGPMYMGHIDVRLGKFVKRHAGELARKPVAGFVVCLAAATKDPEGMAWAEKALAKSLAPIQPKATAVFAGRLDPEKLSWFQRWITKKVKAPAGDFRDWAAIAAWARGLPAKMNS